MPWKWTTGLLLGAALAGGCITSPPCHEGPLVAAYRPGTAAGVTPAPYDATYALYRWPDPPQDPATAAGELSGLRGLSRVVGQEPVGFESGTDGQLLAVAGAQKLPLPPGRYCWHITPDTERKEPHPVLKGTKQALRTVVELPCDAVGTALFILILTLGGGAGWG
jgi:hypothetical protein